MTKDWYLSGVIKTGEPFLVEDNVKLRKTADIEGVLNQKTLSIEEGATLKIKTETYK